MTPQEIATQIELCRRRAKNAESFIAAFKADRNPDISKLRYWEAEMQKQLHYAQELQDELDEMQPSISRVA